MDPEGEEERILMISVAMVTQTLEKLSTTEPAKVQVLMNRMSQEQPFILVYLLAITEREEFDEDETGIFLQAGVVVWQLMRQNPNGSRQITERGLRKAEKSNEALMEDEEGDADNPPISDEHLGAAFLHLKILLDAFIERQK
jgi:hypothetical protein